MEILVVLFILIFSAILHEVAHGYLADRLGDPTARLMGRLTLDPRPHIDTWMSFIVPIMTFVVSGGRFIFGGAKPVPVDPFNLKEGRKDIALVALVGPLVNIAIAVVAASLIKLLLLPGVASSLSLSFTALLYGFLQQVVAINMLLGIFNLIPIPPLDGSKVFSLILPEETAARYMSLGNTGMMIFLILMYTTPVGNFVFGLIDFGTNILLP